MYGSPSGYNTPKGYVSWDDCQRFVSRLNTLLASQLDGKVFRLPTEAEWEFAARGGNDSKGYTYSGSNNLDDVAHYGEEYSEFSQPVPYDVATLQPNELGIYDMSGNVEEWCYDMFGEYEKEPQTNPTGVVIGEYHVVRGGSVISNEYGCRISTRGSGVYTDQNLGFRLVLGAEYSLPSYAYTEYEANGVKFDMVYVDNGTFYMGNDNGSGNEKMDYYLLAKYKEPKKFEDFVYLSQIVQSDTVRYATECWKRNIGHQNGALYWQLNDCWPVASWAAVDYNKQKKAVLYHSGLFNKMLMVSNDYHKSDIDLYVINEFNHSFDLILEWTVFDFYGKKLHMNGTLRCVNALNRATLISTWTLTGRMIHCISVNALNRATLISTLPSQNRLFKPLCGLVFARNFQSCLIINYNKGQKWAEGKLFFEYNFEAISIL